MNLVDVMLHTRIPACRLVDWIDQAFLLVHLGRTDRDVPGMPGREQSGAQVRLGLRRLGVRTATDLLGAFSVEQGESSGAEPRRAFRLPEGLASPFPVDQLRLLVTILDAEPGLVPVRNWQQRGRVGESVSPASRVSQRAADDDL